MSESKLVPIRARASSNLAPLLRTIGSSLLVSTYQAGVALHIRPDPEGLRFVNFPMDKPMGLARRGRDLLIANRTSATVYRAAMELGPRMEPPAQVGFLPVNTRHTGDVDGHDVALGSDSQVWLVNTRFSCLSSLDDHTSFRPRWKPPFITRLRGEDRCHLNGLALVDDRPGYVTALGATNSPKGWSEGRAAGGVLMNVETGETLTRGLSMPHSPRWHRNQLWVLESGRGALLAVDARTGETEMVARMPGFTRGLSFHGNLAFVGLSLMRTSASFKGLPLTSYYPELRCGVWVVDINTGSIVSRLRFVAGIEEIFAVESMGSTSVSIIEPSSDLAKTTYLFDHNGLMEESLET